MKRVTFSGKTRQEVAGKLVQAKSEQQKGVFVQPTGITVGQWLRTWLQQYALPRVRPTTWSSYESLIRLHINPALGSLPLKDLRPEHLQRLYNDKLSSGLSSRTVRLIHVTAHSALKQAMKEGLLAKNASESTSPPRVAKKEMRVLSVEEQSKLLGALNKHRLGILFLMAMATGLRRGELLALRWRDLDLDSGVLEVRRSLVCIVDRSKNKGNRTALLFQEPKSSSGKRTISMPGSILPSLKAYRARQAEERLALGPGYYDNDLVFASEDGKPLFPRNVERAFYRIVEAAGIERANLHSLRHTFATRLLEANEHPKG